MKYESIIKILSLQYKTYSIDSTKDLVQQLTNVRKDSYENNERIVVSMPDISSLNDLQNIINSLDISNFFVMVVTEDKNIVSEIERVTQELSYDTIPFTAVLVDGDEYKIIQLEPTTTNHTTLESRVESLNLPNKTFCVLPWVALEIQPTGEHAVCCLAEEAIKNEQGQTLSVTKNSLDDVLDAHSMKQLRKDFLKGEKPKTCQKCWRVEDSGGISKRLNTLDRLKHLGIANQTWTEERKELLMFDLKIGNICNLKCRICGSYSSSQIATEELPKNDKKNSFAYKTIELGRWPREQDHFWTRLTELSNDIRYLEFTGGEPFLIREHFEFLQQLVDLGIAGQVEIHYNTNGTQYPESAKEIWRHFKLVEIAFSIDDVGPRFEYQRKNAKWDEVNENIAKFKKLKQELGNIHLQVCSTINVFNVMYLEGLANWIDEQEFDNVYWNMLHEEASVSIRTMPAFAKIRATAKLTLALVNDQHKKEFQNAIRFMEQGHSLDGKTLLKKVADKDKLRNENLWDHHPELAEAIGYERT
jgi:MoaA/NifB/PqqE/SkfB family radical SAM enzyme